MRRLFAATAIACLLTGAALAQTATVPADSIWIAVQPYIVDVLVAIMTALLGMIYAWVRAKFGIDIEAKHREALHSAVVTGLNLGAAKIGGVLAGRTISVGSPVVAEAMTWVARSVPDALGHFGITDAKLQELVLAKAQQVFGATAPVVSPLPT